MNIPQVLRSSENQNNVSLTVRSLLVLVIIYLAKNRGVDVGEQEAMTLAEIVITLGTTIVLGYGAVRRLINNKS